MHHFVPRPTDSVSQTEISVSDVTSSSRSITATRSRDGAVGRLRCLPLGREENSRSPMDWNVKAARSRRFLMVDACKHLDDVDEVVPSSDGCEDCLRIHGSWVHLRLCMTCGHVGCCDSSPNHHATAHFHEHPDHPIIRSFEPGEDWWWCYADNLFFEVEGAPPSPSHS
jgi:hypothetical protein